jgi:hypothetical protein
VLSIFDSRCNAEGATVLPSETVAASVCEQGHLVTVRERRYVVDDVAESGPRESAPWVAQIGA